MTVYLLVKHSNRLRPGKAVIHAFRAGENTHTGTTLCGVPPYNPPTAGSIAAVTCLRCRKSLWPKGASR